MKNLKNNKLQKGFVSIETMINIAVVAVLVAGSLILGYKLIDNSRGKSEVENIGLIAQKVRELYAQDASYSGLTNSILTKAGVLNEAMVQGEGVIINAWKRPVTVETAQNGTSFRVTTEGISKEQCVKVANDFRKQALNLQVNGTNIVESSAEVTGAVAALATACNNADNEIIIELR